MFKKFTLAIAMIAAMAEARRDRSHHHDKKGKGEDVDGDGDIDKLVAACHLRDIGDEGVRSSFFLGVKYIEGKSARIIGSGIGAVSSMEEHDDFSDGRFQVTINGEAQEDLFFKKKCDWDEDEEGEDEDEMDDMVAKIALKHPKRAEITFDYDTFTPDSLGILDTATGTEFICDSYQEIEKVPGCKKKPKHDLWYYKKCNMLGLDQVCDTPPTSYCDEE